MTARGRVCVVVSVLALAASSCSGTIVTPKALNGGGPQLGGGGGPGTGDPTPELPPASTCHATATGRTYRGLMGEALEAGRLDVDPVFDRLRPRPNRNISNDWELLGEVQRAVAGDYHGVPAMRDPSVGNTFGNVPPRWYAEADVGAFSLSLVFNFAYESCLYTFEHQRTYWNTSDWLELTDAMPTAVTAKHFCSHSVPYALSRAAKQLELDACVDTILEVQALGEETEPRRVWAYGCAAPLATPMYLTY